MEPVPTLHRLTKGTKKRHGKTVRRTPTLDWVNETEMRFTVAQRRLIIDATMVQDHVIKKLRPVRVKGKLQPVRLTFDEWDDLAGFVFAGAEDHEDATVRKRLARISKRIDRDIFGEWGDEDDRYLKDEDDW